MNDCDYCGLDGHECRCDENTRFEDIETRLEVAEKEIARLIKHYNLLVKDER